MSNKLTLDEILKEPDQQSDPSVALSFTLEDLLNEQEVLDSQQEEDLDDMLDGSDLEQEDIDQVSDTKPSKRSDTVKSVSVLQAIKAPQVAVEVMRTSRIRSSQLKQEILAKNMTYTPLQTVSAAFDPNIKTARGVAMPNCIYSTSSKYLAIGTTLSNVALFQVGVKDFRLLREESKVQGKPTSLCLSQDNKWLVAGFQAGSIIVWDVATSAVVKTVTSLASESPSIIKVLFWKGNADFLSLDSGGNAVLHTIEKYIWTGVRSRKLFQTVSAAYHDAKTTKLENGNIVLALAAVEFIYLIRLEPSLEIITKLLRPSKRSNDIPAIDFGKGRVFEQTADMLAVSWGTSLMVYRYNSLNRGENLFQLYRQFEWRQPICNIQMLSLNTLLIVDSQNAFAVINITQDVQKGAIKHDTTMEQDLFYQRALKDANNEPLKIYCNSVCKCTQDFKEVFFLTRNNVIRGRLHRWTEFIRYLIQERQWDQILKASIEIFYGRLDIFAEKVVISPTTVMLFNELTIVYLKSRLEELQDSRGAAVASQVQEILDTVVEFCLELQLHHHLFESVFQTVSGYGLTEEFFDCLANFISVGKVPQLPNKFVLNSLIEYFVGRRIELVDRLVTGMRPESIDYPSVIEVCHKHKLYYSELYLSELTGDFITPANGVIAECRKLSDQGYSNEKLQTLMQLLYLFITNLLQGNTVTCLPLSQALHESGLRKVVVWYVIRQNSEFLIGEDATKYFEVMVTMMTNPTVCEIADSITETISLAEYVCESLTVLLDAMRNESYRQLLADALVRMSGVWQLQGVWVMYVVEHIKCDSDEEWITKFVNKNLSIILELDTDKTYLKTLPKSVLAGILLRQERYEEAIQAYRQLKDPISNRRLFQRIPEERLALHLQDMLDLSPKFAGDALHSRLSSESIDQAVAQLPNNIFKYELMRRVSKLDRSQDIRWREANSLFYLSSLCSYRPEKRVYEQLRRRDFNILQALQVVRKHGYLLCEAYLEELHCQPLPAFRLYCQVYQTEFKSDFCKLLKFRPVDSRHLKQIFSSAVRMLNSLPFQQGKHHFELFEVVFRPLTSKGMKKKNSTLGEELDQIFRKKGKLHERFSEIFTEIVCESLQLIASAVTVAQMKLLLDLNLSLFQGQLMQERLRMALCHEQRSLVITDSTQKIAAQDAAATFHSLMTSRTKAIAGSSECAICQKRLTFQDAFVYNCGCCIHSECLARIETELIPDKRNPGMQECPSCKLQQEYSTRQLRMRLRPLGITPRKDLRKSSASLNDRNFYFSYLSFDQASKLQDEQRLEYLMG